MSTEIQNMLVMLEEDLERYRTNPVPGDSPFHKIHRMIYSLAQAVEEVTTATTTDWGDTTESVENATSAPVKPESKIVGFKDGINGQEYTADKNGNLHPKTQEEPKWKVELRPYVSGDWRIVTVKLDESYNVTEAIKEAIEGFMNYLFDDFNLGGFGAGNERAWEKARDLLRGEK